MNISKFLYEYPGIFLLTLIILSVILLGVCSLCSQSDKKPAAKREALRKFREKVKGKRVTFKLTMPPKVKEYSKSIFEEKFKKIKGALENFFTFYQADCVPPGSSCDYTIEVNISLDSETYKVYIRILRGMKELVRTNPQSLTTREINNFSKERITILFSGIVTGIADDR